MPPISPFHVCFVLLFFGCLVVVVAHQIDALLPVAGLVVVVVVKEKEHRDWCYE